MSAVNPLKKKKKKIYIFSKTKRQRKKKRKTGHINTHIKKKYSIYKKAKNYKRKKNNNKHKHHLNFKTFTFLLIFYLIGVQKKYIKLYRDFKIFVLRSFVHKSEIIVFFHLIRKQIDEKQCLFLKIKFFLFNICIFISRKKRRKFQYEKIVFFQHSSSLEFLSTVKTETTCIHIQMEF